VLDGILLGIIDASLLRKAMQSCSGVDNSIGRLKMTYGGSPRGTSVFSLTDLLRIALFHKLCHGCHATPHRPVKAQLASEVVDDHYGRKPIYDRIAFNSKSYVANEYFWSD
jgi:hypothetical protein